VGSVKGMVPILRAFGVDDDGHSMALFIHGFTPYSYFALPEGYELDQSNGDSTLAAIRDMLTLRLESAARGAAAQSAVVLGVTYVTDHKSIMGYDTPHTKFLKIYLSLPGLVATLKRIMEEGINLPGIKATASGNAADNTMMPVYQAFECNVPFVLRFMVDRDISGAGWMTLPAETYEIRDPANKETHCQVSGRMNNQ
jgi:DNA polymerase delta subunit 1